ncbi:MAG: PAS domain S-box protein, partial [Desulfobacterales bacterium]
MRLYGRRRLYLPAISIILVVILLLGIIGVSTYRNWHRERQMTLSYIHGRGVTLIRALEAGARSGMMMHLWREDSIGSLIYEMAQTDDVLYIYLFDAQGRIVHHSDEAYLDQMAQWEPPLSKDHPIVTRIRKASGQPMVYEMAKTFTPMQGEMDSRLHTGGRAHSHSGDTLVVGLDMANYEASQSEDLHHALVMGGILVALGSGVLFFVFVIQNYYLVNRSLKASQDFNRLVLNSMADGLISIDSDGRILTHNGQAAKLLGHTGESMEGRKLSTILDLTGSGIQSALTRRQFLLNHEIRHQCEPSREVIIGMTISPLSRD